VPRREEVEALAREYLIMADELLHPPNPSLMAIGGFSGSGKSTLAAGLAPSFGAVPGAVVLRSDEIRKRLCGASPLEHLGPEGYTPKVSEQVYAILAERAGVVIRAGHGAIVDAVYARPQDRQVIERAAADASVPFVGLWLDAPEATLLARIDERRNDPSDADADVVRMQRTQESGVIEWHRLDTSISSERVLQSASAYLETRNGGGWR
jgi:predicted kinase